MQRQTRSMQRSESIGRGKRSLDCSGGGGDDEQPERKRPALASVIVEALKMDSLQKLCSSLEPVLRRVVSEEVERALAKLGPARISGRSSPKRIEGSDGRSLRLHFKSRLSLPLFTGGKVEGEQGAAIHIVLIDANTGHAVISGPESSAKLDVVVLEGDFNNEDDDDWTKEEFESNVVKERDGKRPLLTGELQVTLKEGVGTLGDLTFTDNSSWIRSRKFRLGLKVAPGYCEGVRVREAKTEAFTVKDHRGELYKKHYPPALNDEVWRLEKIGKDGAFHKKLNASGINTVKDFLLLAVRDSQKLRNILGSGMSNRMWESLMDHAKTCALSGKLYVYYPNDTRDVGVVFNNIYELHGLITGDQYLSPDQLCDSQKVYVDTLVKKAYENWNQVIEYDGKSLLSSKQIRRAIPSGNELPMGPISYSNALNSQLALPPLSVRVQPEQPLVVPSLPGAGYNGNLAAGYPNQPLMQNSNSHNQFESSSFTQHDLLNTPQQIQITSADRRMGLAPGPQQSFVPGFHNINPSIQQPNVNPDDDWSQNREKGAGEFFSEEEIRLRSNELLQDEDMQHEMLRILSMGGHASMNMFEDALSYPSYMASPAPNFSFGDERSRSGKAVVGWLKIKAAMRWGFFIRKKAAERRAQLVEIDDE